MGAGPALYRVRIAGGGGRRQCGEPHRRARRPGDHAGDHRLPGVRGHHLSGRQRHFLRLSRHSARAGRGRPHRIVPVDRRRGPGLLVVQRAAGGGLHGRHRQPGFGRRTGRDRGGEQA